MVVTLEHIYLSLQRSYKLQLVAGNQEIRAVMSGVQMVENTKSIGRLKKQELVLTTGAGFENEEALLTFCKMLCEKQMGGCIIGLGGNLLKMPTNVITFCQEQAFPLLTLSSDRYLAEVMRQIKEKILREETLEESIVGAFKKALLFPERREECEQVLAQWGLARETTYCLIALMSAVDELGEGETELLRGHVEDRLSWMNERYILVEQEDVLYLICADFKEEEKQSLVDCLESMQLSMGKRFYCAVGKACVGLEEVAKEYPKMRIFLNLLVRQGKWTAWYEELDLYRLLLGVEDHHLLQVFYDQTMGRLLNYDTQNQTKYYDLLSQYLQRSGHIKELAEANYVHRNTVTYQLKKIEKILDINLEDWKVCSKLYICMLIRDIL